MMTANKLIALFLVSGFLFLHSSITLGQEASQSGKIQIDYPVSTLGNCANLEKCKAYCDNEAHKDACIAFAKSKGFYKAPAGTGNARSRLVLAKAKEELGCSSEQACKELCMEQENKQKCEQFAKKYNLRTKKELNSSTLEKAKTVLDCDSGESCKALCQNEANREKCTAFAKQNKLQGSYVEIATVSAKNKENFEKVQQTIDDCTKDPEKCINDFEKIEKELSAQSDDFCKTNPEKCKQPLKPEKKEIASKEAKLKSPLPSKEPKEPKAPKDGDVQGVSKELSFFGWLFNIFLK